MESWQEEGKALFHGCTFSIRDKGKFLDIDGDDSHTDTHIHTQTGGEKGCENIQCHKTTFRNECIQVIFPQMHKNRKELKLLTFVNFRNVGLRQGRCSEMKHIVQR